MSQIQVQFHFKLQWQSRAKYSVLKSVLLLSNRVEEINRFIADSSDTDFNVIRRV